MTSVARDGAVDEQAREVLAAWTARPERVVLFDFNGTLSNDEPLLLAVYADMFREHLGTELTAGYYYQHYAGLSDREIIVAGLEKSGRSATLRIDDLLTERHDRYAALVAAESPILPTTADAVRALSAAGVRLGIVTGAPGADVRLVLASSGLLDVFEVVVAEEDVEHGKPDPSGFLDAAARMGCSASSALVLEDSLPGVRAAAAARMTCVAVEGTCTREELTGVADAVVGAITPGLFGLA